MLKTGKFNENQRENFAKLGEIISFPKKGGNGEMYRFWLRASVTKQSANNFTPAYYTGV